MTDRLCLFAPATPADPWRFSLLRGQATTGQASDAEGEGLDAAREALAAATPESAGAARSGSAPLAVELVIPGEAVLRTAVQVPARSRRQLEMAVPFLVEEYLAEDVEETHLALGSRQAGGRMPVTVIAPRLLEGWLEALAQADLDVRRARVDLDALDTRDVDIDVLVTADRALVSQRDGDAVAVPRDLLERVLAAMLERMPAGADPVGVRLRTQAADGGFDLAELDSALAQLRPVTLVRESLNVSSQRWIATALANAAGPELLQGRFAPASSGSGAGRRWRLVAGLAAVWLVAQLGLDVGRTMWLEARAAELREDSVAMFRQIYPDRTRVPDPRRELQALLDSGGGASEARFLDLLGAAANRIGGLESERIELRSLSFNAQRGDLSLDMDASGIAAVDRFKAGLDQAGYPVVIDSAVQESQGVRARVRITGGGS